MGNACSNCASTEEESQFEMSEHIETANFGAIKIGTPAHFQKHGDLLQPQRVAIQSQRLEELPNRFKGGQYVLD